MQTSSFELSQNFTKNLEKNTKILSTIKRVSMENLQKAYGLMQKLEDPITLEVLKQSFPDFEHPDIQDTVSEKLEIIIQDSKIILGEMDLFLQALSKNELPKRKECPLFRQAWDGELYGESGYEGLILFSEDLEKVNLNLGAGIGSFVSTISKSAEEIMDRIHAVHQNSMK